MGSIEINNVFWVKIGFIIVVFFEALLSGYFPTWSKTCRESPKILGIANSFAAGVFIAIALVHILPEEAANWAGLYPPEADPFPLPYFLMFCGYCLILVIDKVMFDTHALFDHDDEHGDHALDPAEQKLQSSIKRSFAQVQMAEMRGSQVDVRKSMAKADNDLKKSMKEFLSSTDKFAVRLKASMSNQTAGQELDNAQDLEDQNKYFVASAPRFSSQLDRNINTSGLLSESEQTAARKSEGGVQDVEKQMHQDIQIQEIILPKKQCCNATPYILMIALSVHACFEGIALGLQSSMISTLNIVLAIVIHKGAASSALGISLVKTFPNNFRLVRQLVFLFSIATPLGVVIGILASSAGEIVDVVMSSLAAGTFVYIACTEIIVEEFSVNGYRCMKLFFFILGACIISSLSFIKGS